MSELKQCKKCKWWNGRENDTHGYCQKPDMYRYIINNTEYNKTSCVFGCIWFRQKEEND